MGDNGTHNYPGDCPFVNDHDTIIKMAERIQQVHYAIYAEDTGILASFIRLNGRVKKLELWRAGLAGSIAIIIPLVVYLTHLVEKVIK